MKLIGTIGTVAGTIAIIGGAFFAGAAVTHSRTVAVPVIRIVHVKSKPVVVTRWRTRTVVRRIQVPSGAPEVPCFGGGLGQVYPAASGGALGATGYPLVQCTVSFYPSVPASGGANLRLTTVATPRYPQPISDSYTLVNTRRG